MVKKSNKRDQYTVVLEDIMAYYKVFEEKFKLEIASARTKSLQKFSSKIKYTPYDQERNS